MQTIIASETNTGFNFCTTEFSGEIENIGYNLYHYYDEEKKIDTLTSKNATRSLWPSDYDIEVSDDAKSNVEDYFDLLEFGEEHDVEFKTLPMDIMKEFLKVAKEVVQDNAEKDPIAMKIHLHYQDFLKKAIDVTKYQESGYLQAREMANNV